jgi:AcrR family transcriptional regulator
MSATRSARERVHDEVTGEILAVAKAHLAREGAAGLSLRSIARELEIAPSALYRYFDSRDALLSALIIGAYGSLADEAERSSQAAYAGGGDTMARWVAVPLTMRAWALAHPHEWSLIFGSPVPGYQAPQETIAPYIRLAQALVRPIVDAHQDGTLRPAPVRSGADEPLAAALQPVTEGLLPGLPTNAVAQSMLAFAALIGAISLELFGHFHNTVLAPELLFAETVAQLAASTGVCPSRGDPPG